MVFRILLLLCLSLSTVASVEIEATCESALKSLFSNTITKKQASDFLKIQGELTLNRLAWAYLKSEQSNKQKNLESVEKTILSLLQKVHESKDPGFINARNQFEAQPLSRTALADVGRYLKDLLFHQFGDESQAFILSSSDLKLLHAISKFERKSSVRGRFASRMLDSESTGGMMNFAKLVNSHYQKDLGTSKTGAQLRDKTQSLEKIILGLQKKVNSFIGQLHLPEMCANALDCRLPDESFGEVFSQSENIQKIFWEALSEKLSQDDALLKNLTYGKFWLKASSPGEFASSTGLYIKNPIGVIVREDPIRNTKAYELMDRDYLEKRADTVLNDDKIFELEGKLYSRRTGRVVSVEKALLLMPPSKRTIAQNNSTFYLPHLAALINGDRAFVDGRNLYSDTGRTLDPALTIATEMNRKKSTKFSKERYASMERDYLNARACALLNNKPYFKTDSQVFDSETGKNLNSSTRGTVRYEDVKIQKQRRILYQYLSNAETVINFHRDHPNKTGCQNYAVVDKKLAKISVYHLNGHRVFMREILVSSLPYDNLSKDTTGGGVFTVSKAGSQKLQFSGESSCAISSIPEEEFNPYHRRIPKGCLSLKQKDFAELAKWIKPSCKVYVIPEEINNKFIVKDRALELVSSTRVTGSKVYKYSLEAPSYRPISIKITNKAGNTKQSVEFIKTLIDEKEKLMSIFKLTNDDYNELAAVSYGIMGNETSFGASKKYEFKEIAQNEVILARAASRLLKMKNPFDRSIFNTSRGPTQIKFLSEDKKWKAAYPHINKENLSDPRNSAVATVAYLVGAVKTLKNIAVHNKLDPGKVQITKENMVEYLGYIYQGRKGYLTSATDPANADFNTYCQKIKKHVNYIEISQKIE